MTALEKTQTHLSHQTFPINGMTCEACVKTVTAKISSLPGVTSVDVSLANKTAHVESHHTLTNDDIKGVLKNTKYSIEETKNQESDLKTYKPLITVFAFVFLASGAYQVSLDHFHPMIFMNHIMAGFFIGLSFFKFLDLNAFSESFSSYDPIAQRWLGYGKIYPFIELLLGLLFVSGKILLFANSTTVLILTVTTYGVYKRLQSKSKFQCACMGTSFNLPLSNVTIAENLAMISMGIYGMITLT